ncbi:LysR substrate-binding domain-containing protein [Nocardia nepalensis]|uniref:LysR substrate-binding domain-containing protein n=1 Tax=Nocardia nepalensis TaxID=3375448 RepID=UPI003B67EFE6
MSVRKERVLRLAVTPGAPPRLASALRRAAADPAPEITDLQTAEQLPRLRGGALDAGVLLLPADVAGLHHVTIEHAELGVVVATGHRLAGRHAVRWADLEGSALLWFARSSVRPVWDVWPGDGLVWVPFAADALRIRYALVWNPADSFAARYREIAADLVAADPPHTHPVLPRGQRYPRSAVETDRAAPR